MSYLSYCLSQVNEDYNPALKRNTGTHAFSQHWSIYEIHFYIPADVFNARDRP